MPINLITFLFLRLISGSSLVGYSYAIATCRGSLDETPRGHEGDLGNETTLFSVIFNEIQWNFETTLDESDVISNE